MIAHKTRFIVFSLYAFSLITFVSLFFYFGKDISHILSHLPWWAMCLVVLLHIPAIAGGGLAFEVLCSRFHIHLRYKDWFGLSFIANFLNQLLPYRPGMGFRYLYLRKQYAMKPTYFFNIMLFYLLLTLIISAIFTLIGWLGSTLPIDFQLMLFITLFLGLGTSAAFFWIKTQKQPHRAFTVLHALLNHRVILIKTVLILIGINIISTFIFYILFSTMHAPIPIMQCVFLVGIYAIAMLFPITPGNIGLLEVLFGTLTQVLYQDFSLGLSVIALYRVTMWIPSVVLGTGFSLLLIGSTFPYFKRVS